ncbi:hypothetical protein FOZ62_020310, partial [Perkinsus olseni]
HLGETSAVTLERKKLFSRAIGKPKPAVTPPPPQPSPEPAQEAAPAVDDSKQEAVSEAPVAAPKSVSGTPPSSVASLAKKRGFKNMPIERSAVHPSPVVAPQPAAPAVPQEQQQPATLPESAAVTSSVPTPETEAASKDKDSWEETSSSEGEPAKAAVVHEEAEVPEGEETPSAQSSE